MIETLSPASHIRNFWLRHCMHTTCNRSRPFQSIINIIEIDREMLSIFPDPKLHKHVLLKLVSPSKHVVHTS
jgi:hypothetical protein